MPKSPPPYAPELQRRLVAMVRAGRSPAELAKDFEPSEQCIRNWVKQADRDAGKRQDGPTSAEKKELARRIGRMSWFRDELLLDLPSDQRLQHRSP